MLLSESPFRCRFLHTLFSLSCVLLFPSYWFIDRLLSCVVLTSVERSRGPARRVLSLVLGVPFFILLFLLSLPLGVIGFVFWSLLHRGRRPFCYQRHLQTHDLPEKTLSHGCSFIFISANLCLLPDGLARFSNLSHTQCRTSVISKILSLPTESVQTSEDSLPICSTEDVLPMVETLDKEEMVKHGEGDVPFEVSLVFPKNADFLCLQEVFDGRASRKLRSCLAPSFPHILYDVGPTGPHSGGFKFFNSGLFLASRHLFVNAKYYYYPNACGEDALAAKGLLCVKVLIGITEQKQRLVGYINCTHLHAPECDAIIRCDQMSLLLQWVSDFQTQHKEDGELVVFDVLCGDLNFDNCSSAPANIVRLPRWSSAIQAAIIYPQYTTSWMGGGNTVQTGSVGTSDRESCLKDLRLITTCFTLLGSSQAGRAHITANPELRPFSLGIPQTEYIYGLMTAGDDEKNYIICVEDDCLEQKHKLFTVYKDPCRDCAGRDRPGAVGTLLRQDLLYHDAVNTPANLKSTLQSDTERKLYVAPPIPQDGDGDGDGTRWTGRRIDYILYRQMETVHPVAVDKFQFITQLAGLSDHIPVSLHLSTSIPVTASL